MRNLQIKSKLITRKDKSNKFKIIVCTNCGFYSLIFICRELHLLFFYTLKRWMYICHFRLLLQRRDTILDYRRAFTKFGEFCYSRKKGSISIEEIGDWTQSGESRSRLLYTVASSTVMHGGVAEQRHPLDAHLRRWQRASERKQSWWVGFNWKFSTRILTLDESVFNPDESNII